MGGLGELEPGAMITPGLRLDRRIGGGGMGAVWLAHHAGLDTKVVVKFIAQSIADNPMNVARFRREAAAAAAVKSPHVVQMFDYGVVENGRPYLVMELLVGRDLGEHLREHRVLQPHDVVSIIRQVCKALQRAHDLGIIHRDIKPENIFLCDHDDGETFVKLLDFGIAKAEDQADVTTTGAAVGTPHYMSPEQAIGSKTIDHRTDLWSLGVLTYFLCTGRRPFAGETTGALTLAIFNGPIPRPSEANPTLPKAFDAWFQRACARDANARFPSAKVLANELADALMGDVTRAIVDVDAVSYRPDAEADLRSAPTVKMNAGPTPPASNPDEFAPVRTTAGLASVALPPPPMRSRAPMIGGALAVSALVGFFMWTRRPEPAAAITATPPPLVEVASAKPTPTPSASAPIPTAAPAPSTSASAAPTPSVAAPTKPVKKSSGPAVVSSATGKKPQVDEPDLK